MLGSCCAKPAKRLQASSTMRMLGAHGVSAASASCSECCAIGATDDTCIFKAQSRHAVVLYTNLDAPSPVQRGHQAACCQDRKQRLEVVVGVQRGESHTVARLQAQVPYESC